MERIGILGPPLWREPGTFPAKGFQLLALLASNPRERHSRLRLARILWGGSDDGDAAANLRQLLVRVRRCAGDTLIVAGTGTLILDPSGEALDLVAFQRLRGSRDNGELNSALALYRGDLLEGAEADASEAMLEWLAVERSRLRYQFLDTASALLVEKTRYGRCPVSEIEAIVERMLQVDPDREESFRLGLQVLARCGHYVQAEAMLARLTARATHQPSLETLAIARRAFASAVRSFPELPQSAPSLPDPRQPGGRPRVAFLPLTRLRPSPQGFLLDAVIDDIANELSRYRSFAVMATHSSFQVQQESGLPVDNSVLRADFAVGGFVRPDGDVERVALRMVHCATGEISWAGEFRLTPDALDDTFRQITVRVASSLALELEHYVLSELRHARSQSAYRRYLEGLDRLRRCDLPRLRLARAAFRSAAAEDPTFAPAFARIAQTIYLEWLTLGGNDPSLLVAAKSAAEAAIERDRHAAIGHWVGAAVALYQRDFDLAAAGFAEAEVLAPHSADLLLEHADALGCSGDPDAGWERFQRALDLSPLPPEHYWWAGASIALNRGDYAAAVELCSRLTNEEPVLRILAASYARLGDRFQATLYGRRLRETYPGMAAAEMARLVPYRNADEQQFFAEGLRMAGVP